AGRRRDGGSAGTSFSCAAARRSLDDDLGVGGDGGAYIRPAPDPEPATFGDDSQLPAFVGHRHLGLAENPPAIHVHLGGLSGPDVDVAVGADGDALDGPEALLQVALGLKGSRQQPDHPQENDDRAEDDGDHPTGSRPGLWGGGSALCGHAVFSTAGNAPARVFLLWRDDRLQAERNTVDSCSTPPISPTGRSNATPTTSRPVSPLTAPT